MKTSTASTKTRALPQCRIGVAARNAFTILELLVTMSLITVLVGLIFPAIQHAREGARNLQCFNNLKQIGTALHNHHDIAGHLPAGWKNAPSGRTAWGWATEILPMLEQSVVASAIHRDLDVNHDANGEPRRMLMAVLICPSDAGPSEFELFRDEDYLPSADDDFAAFSGSAETEESLSLPRANYVGIFGNHDPDESAEDSGEGTFIGNTAIRWRDLTRGLSNVAIVGERTARRLPVTWIGVDLLGEDACARLTAHADLGPNVINSDECEMDSRHPGSINVLFADGHVRRIHDTVDRHVYQSMARRQQ